MGAGSVSLAAVGRKIQPEAAGGPVGAPVRRDKACYRAEAHYSPCVSRRDPATVPPCPSRCPSPCLPLARRLPVGPALGQRCPPPPRRAPRRLPARKTSPARPLPPTRSAPTRRTGRTTRPGAPRTASFRSLPPRPPSAPISPASPRPMPPRTIRRRLAALGKMHRFNDLPWNPAHRDIQGPLQGLLRQHGRPAAEGRPADAGHAAPAGGDLRQFRPRPARPGPVAVWLRRRAAPLRAGGAASRGRRRSRRRAQAPHSAQQDRPGGAGGRDRPAPRETCRDLPGAGV